MAPKADSNVDAPPAPNKPSIYETKPPSWCVMCRTSTAKLCDGCKSVSYCSKECQKDDWVAHKSLCKQVTAFFATRPSTSHCAGIVFPEDEHDPKLVWVKCDPLADVASLLGRPSSEPEPLILTNNRRRSYDLGHSLVLYERKGGDGSQSSMAIIKITGGVRAKDYRGPVLVLPETRRGSRYRDITLADVRVAVDHFVSEGHRLKRITNLQKKPEYIHGVLLVCPNDNMLFGWPHIKDIRVHPGDHPISIAAKHMESELYVSPPTPGRPIMSCLPGFARSLGLDIVTQMWVPTSHIQHRASFWYVNNRASVLHSVMDVQANCLRESVENIGLGNVLIIRKDWKPLTARQVEAMCEFYFNDVETEEPGPRARIHWGDFNALTDTQGFIAFFGRLKEKKAKKDAAWNNEVCPV